MKSETMCRCRNDDLAFRRNWHEHGKTVAPVYDLRCGTLSAVEGKTV